MSAVVQFKGSTIKRRLFLERSEYQTCHICLPDTQERMAAIALDQAFYSFFKTVSDRERALDVLARLYDGGHHAVITRTPRAYALWVLEKDAVRL